MNNKSQLDIFHQFTQKQEQRTHIAIGGEIEAILDYCQYVVHTQYDKKSKKKFRFKERKNQVSEDFMRAYNTLDRQDKIRYYIKNVKYLIRIRDGNMKTPQLKTEVLQANVYSQTHNLRRWKKKIMRLDNSRQIIYAEKQKTIKEYDLGDYIFRGSKNTKYYSFVLEAIKSTVHQKSKTVHFGFESMEEMQRWAQAVQLCIDYKHWQRIYIEMYQKLPQKTGDSSTRQSALPDVDMSRSKTGNIVQNIMAESNSLNLTEKLVTKNQKDELKKSNKKQQQSSSFSSDDDAIEDGEVDRNFGATRTIIQDLVEGENENESIENIQNRNIQQKQDTNMKHLNIFHKMFPEFQFSEVQYEGNFEMVHKGNSMRVIQNIADRKKYKMIVDFQSEKQTTCECIFKALCGPDFVQSYNENVQDIQVKTLISSQNAAIMYMALKPFNKIYRGRDFVFIRHVFSNGNSEFYIADKDIENTNFPPFMTIVRGKYECVWSILRKPQGKVKLVADIFMENQGYLNDNQNTNLVLNYFKHFQNLPNFVRCNKQKLKQFVMFDINWDITKNKQNQKQDEIRMKKKAEQAKVKKVRQKPVQQRESPTLPKQSKKLNYQKDEIVTKQVIKVVPTQSSNTLKDLQLERQKMSNQQIPGEIDPSEIKKQQKFETNNEIKLKFDNKGLIIIDKGFIRARYQLTPTKSYPTIYWPSPAPGLHPLWTDDWKHDSKNGGLFFINPKKLQDQKGVLKFILSKIGKNLLSGKSILNISLPVDIFTSKSNLQLFIQSICYALSTLQRVASMDRMQKFKAAFAFGISMSALYLIMQKPFNPILGETFQAWINGCPAYAEQISHHPPICSLIFYGRGFTISGQFESKAELHMNSGTGTNEGIWRINFDDGGKYCFCTAGGEVSGLTYGDRKFNVQGKGYCWSPSQNYFTEIVYNPAKKGFFSMKKQEQPEDFFEGLAVKVTPQFINSLNSKRRAPSEKQVTAQVGRFHGVWHQQIFYENESLLNISKQLPLKLEYEKNPLPSDSNWREDIAYRRLMQIPRAQSEKERLEVFQRNDRKLREKK